jgi:hypothetical protein
LEAWQARGKVDSRHLGCRSDACSSGKRGKRASTKMRDASRRPGVALRFCREEHHAGRNRRHLAAGLDEVRIVARSERDRE